MHSMLRTRQVVMRKRQEYYRLVSSVVVVTRSVYFRYPSRSMTLYRDHVIIQYACEWPEG